VLTFVRFGSNFAFLEAELNTYMLFLEVCQQVCILFSLSSVGRLLILQFSSMGAHLQKLCSASFTNLPPNNDHMMSVVSLQFTFFTLCASISDIGNGRSFFLISQCLFFLYKRICTNCFKLWFETVNIHH
jgi:hypothetical protein